MPSRSKGGGLTGKDARDWERVIQDVTPLKGSRSPDTKDVEAAPSEPAKSESAQKTREVAGHARAAPQDTPSRSIPSRSKPGAKLDQPHIRQLRRGRQPDARIDLHGLRQSEAHGRLLAFLKMARANGHRLVLVITGKGRPSAQGEEWWDAQTRGVLRRSVPDWLSSSAFREHVAAFSNAGRVHGGDGAFYVQLRRRGTTGAER